MRFDRHIALACAALAAFALGCDDDANSDPDPIVLPDMAADPEPEPEPEPDMAPDMAPPEPDMAPDMAPPEPDAGPVIENPEALIYENDPVTDEGELTRVVLHPVTTPNGALTSEWVQVFNCLNEEGGLVAMPFGPGVSIRLCHEVQVARPGPEGHYDHIAPSSDTDPNDSFAELMMYHHVNRVHDYFKDTFGFTDLDFPLPALVNVQFQVDPPALAAGFGLQTDEEGWFPFDNAAFFPKESWDALAGQFGLPGRDSDSIIFFQGQYDFAYDGRVIYHEYTHAVVGTGRLQAPAVPDEYGLSNSAPSMNEGLADYFAASLSDDPVIGAYVGGILGLGGLRNLAEPRRCPDDTVDQIHTHGQLIGATMWAVREEIGAEVADGIAFRALEQFTPQTTHAEAGALMLAEAEAIGGEVFEVVSRIFTENGFGECERSIAFDDWTAMGSRDRLPHNIEGLQTLGFGGYNDLGVPAFKQFHIDGDAVGGAAAVRVSWRMQPGGQGGFGGGGGGPLELDLAVRRGQPILFDYADGVAAEYDLVVSPAAEDGVQSVVFGGDCMPAAGEKLHTLWLNKTDSTIAVHAIEVEFLDAPPEGAITCAD